MLSVSVLSAQVIVAFAVNTGLVQLITVAPAGNSVAGAVMIAPLPGHSSARLSSLVCAMFASTCCAVRTPASAVSNAARATCVFEDTDRSPIVVVRNVAARIEVSSTTSSAAISAMPRSPWGGRWTRWSGIGGLSWLERPWLDTGPHRILARPIVGGAGGEVQHRLHLVDHVDAGRAANQEAVLGQVVDLEGVHTKGRDRRR